MNNFDLGYNESLEAHRLAENLVSFEVARVILVHKGRYILKNEQGEYDAELIGNLRFSLENKNDFPVVGDWVAFSEYDENKALIHGIFPRKTVLQRRAVGEYAESQIIAANVDFGIIVQSVNRDFSINRLERYITLCNMAHITPIIVLSKIDLIEKKEELEELLNLIQDRIKNISVFAISNENQKGIDELKSILTKGQTYCLLGSSGVGKSTLINSLTGKNIMATAEISKAIDRGKHVTTHRELILMENGILIDNPGMREVGITDISEGLEMTFDEILSLSMECKFKDCKHINEKGCAVLDALESGGLNSESYENYLKMEKERAFFESSVKEKKEKGKNLSKLIRQVKKRDDL